jgi:carboxypeptidase Taq
MQYNNTSAALAALQEIEAKRSALSHAMAIIYFDSATVAPKNTTEGRAHTLGILSGYMYELIASPENTPLLSYLKEHESELSAEEKRRAELFRKECEQLSRIPQDEYTDFQILLSKAGDVWEKAKVENDFPAFAPYLEKIVESNRKFAGYYNPNVPAYDALLNEFEEGVTMDVLD